MKKNVQFEDFCETMRGLVQERLPEFEVKIQKILKNNATEKVCLHIRSKEAENMVPCIYLEPYYENFVSSDVTMESLTEDVLATYQNSKNVDEIGLEHNLDWISDFEKCKGKLCYRLRNHEMNKLQAEYYPSIPFLDLDIVFYLQVNNEEGCTSSIQVNNHLLELWDVDTSTLLRYARKNTPKLFPLKVASMSSMIGEVMGDEDVFSNVFEGNDPFLILTNESNLNGAITILYADFFEQIVEKFPDMAKEEKLILLPSSIHEMLVLGSSFTTDLAYLKEMVCSVNGDSKVMHREDVLGNSVYYYNPSTKEFMIAEE